MRTLRFATLFVAVLIGAMALWTPHEGHAQSPPVSDDPGYVDLNQFAEALDMRPNIEVNIQGALLDMVSSRAERQNSDAGRLMQNLRSIQVRGFPIADASPADYEAHFDRFTDDLKSEGWEQVVFVREDDQRVSMLMRHHDDAVAGLTVMVSDPSDARLLFINIVGSIQPDELDTIMGGSGLDMGEVASPSDDNS